MRQFVYWDPDKLQDYLDGGFTAEDEPKLRRDIEYKVDTETDKNGVVRHHPLYSDFYTLIDNINECCPPDIFHDTLQGMLGYLIDYLMQKLPIKGSKKEKYQNINDIIKKEKWNNGHVKFNEKMKLMGSAYQKYEFFQVCLIV